MKTDYVLIDKTVYRHFQGDNEDNWSLERIYLENGKIVGRRPTPDESKKALLAMMSGSMEVISLSKAVKLLEKGI